MLSLRILPRGINHYFKQSSQQFHTCIRLCSTKDLSSSSSSSSDLDSDENNDSFKTKKILTLTERLKALEKNLNIDAIIASEKVEECVKKEVKTQKQEDSISSKIKQSTEKKINIQTEEGSNKNLKIPISNEKLKHLDKTISNMKIDVAIKPKAARFKKTIQEPTKKKFEDELKTAAKDVAETLGGDTRQTEIELLDKLFQSSTDKTASISTEESKSMRDIIKTMTYEKEKTFSQEKEITYRKERSTHFKQKAWNVIKGKNLASEEEANDLVFQHLQSLDILSKISPIEKIDSPQLLTWDAMQAREIQLALQTVPQNCFQELILWTEEGKLWHFPINNEQGMEEEEKIHFSEHVFMERHLKDWCPKRGPIRHFMELVCAGLSKNPYMTVEEKIEHITWYKNYFEDKKDLLHELGVLDNKAVSSPTSDQKKVEA